MYMELLCLRSFYLYLLRPFSVQNHFISSCSYSFILCLLFPLMLYMLCHFTINPPPSLLHITVISNTVSQVFFYFLFIYKIIGTYHFSFHLHFVFTPSPHSCTVNVYVHLSR
uniref:Uncharacterized protein n=1 Tax=Cacopsylla melanoneura TaxID=428564 RepID=A0A8D9BH47_9HEMI